MYFDDNIGTSIFGYEFSINVPNQDNTIDLEEQQRQQEEIIKHVYENLSDYETDNESTIHTLPSLRNINNENKVFDHTCNEKITRNFDNGVLLKKYEMTTMDQHLQVLYEIRVNEVTSLQKRLHEIQMEMSQLKMDNSEIKTLLEVEKNKAKVSHEQSQALLVNKNEDISKLQLTSVALENTVSNLQKTITKLNEDKTVLMLTITELNDRLVRLNTKQISDMMYEEQQQEIVRKEKLLNEYIIKLETTAKEYFEYKQLSKKQYVELNDSLSNKNKTINDLRCCLEEVQERYSQCVHQIKFLQGQNDVLNTRITNDSLQRLKFIENVELVNALKRELGKARDVQISQRRELEIVNDNFAKLQDARRIDMANYDELLKKKEEVEIHLRSRSAELKDIQEKYEMVQTKYDEMIIHQQDKQYKDRSIQMSPDLIKTFQANFIKEKDGSLEAIEIKQRGIMERQIFHGQDTCDNISEKKLVDKCVQITMEKDDHRKTSDTSTQVSMSCDKEERNYEELTEAARILSRHLLETKRTVTTLKVALEKSENQIECLRGNITSIGKHRETISTGTNTDDALEKQIRTELLAKFKQDYDMKFDQWKRTNLKKYDEQVNAHYKDQIQKLEEKRNEEIRTVVKTARKWKEMFTSIEHSKRILDDEYLRLKNDYLKLGENFRKASHEALKKECMETIKMGEKKFNANLRKFASRYNTIDNHCKKTQRQSRNDAKDVLDANK